MVAHRNWANEVLIKNAMREKAFFQNGRFPVAILLGCALPFPAGFCDLYLVAQHALNRVTRPVHLGNPRAIAIAALRHGPCRGHLACA